MPLSMIGSKVATPLALVVAIATGVHLGFVDVATKVQPASVPDVPAVKVLVTLIWPISGRS